MPGRGFFASFPHYRNVFDSLAARDDLVTVFGHSERSDPSLAGPALWTAMIRGDQVSGWRVHEDTPATRKQPAVPDSR
ncbi:hypothetical protein [Streptomyces sp. SLBN-118]|uniref:hypothetical protein n=1 Tax=Streptomyces sp. SLBN-118 TaxID=2768454 RepID=UPI00114F35A1|nr:hypothetical protein [Streptomyces sp. SLBN-118]